MKSIKIKDTTREERIRIVAEALAWCDDSSCEACSGCSLGIGSIEDMYRPYIEGEMEIAEINQRNAAKHYVHG